MTTRTIDLNADVGERPFGSPYQDEQSLLQSVTSASVACGWHAGDPSSIRETLAIARACGVAVGAHPSYPDRKGFGRRILPLTSREIADGVTYQVAALAALAALERIDLRHVKPHGALYNVACRDRDVATAITAGILAVGAPLAIYAPPASVLAHAAAEAGLRVVSEGFADRSYEADGSLTPRTERGAVLVDADAITERALAWMRTGDVSTRDGAHLHLPVETLCVHGDTPGAAALAAQLRRSLEQAGIVVEAVAA